MKKLVNVAFVVTEVGLVIMGLFWLGMVVYTIVTGAHIGFTLP